MLKQLKGEPAAKGPFAALSAFKDSAWKALNSYTRSGIHPLGRMVDAYPLEMFIANVKVSNALQMVGAMQYCVLTGVKWTSKTT